MLVMSSLIWGQNHHHGIIDFDREGDGHGIHARQIHFLLLDFNGIINVGFII